MRTFPLALVALLLAAFPSLASAAAPRALLPDLAQGTPTDIGIALDSANGQPQVRLTFHSSVANVGEGPLVLSGRRAPGATDMTAHQVVRRSDGSSYVRSPSAGTLKYVRASDHEHWHLLGFDRYELWSQDGARKLRGDRKQGFCLGDRFSLLSNKRMKHQPLKPEFTTYCAKNQPGITHIVEGISVGWGDDYRANIEGQYIDVTTIPAGRYLLVHRTNATHGLRELNPYNDVACAAIELRAPSAADQPPTVVALSNAQLCRATYDRWGVVPGG
jgi:hypothetical protein